jgi:hypothetical protein
MLQEFRTLPPRSLVVAPLIAGLIAVAAPLRAQQLDVPYVPTPQAVVDHMLTVAGVSEKDYVIDLGSGDGRIAVTAAEKFGARAMGVDLNPVRIAEAEANARRAGVTDRVTFREQNLFDTEIGEATVLTMYLLPRVNIELRPRVLKELRAGTRVVSHAFDMGDWEADQHDIVTGRDVYLWIVPAQVEGRWSVEGGDGGKFTVELKQQYQKIHGTATDNGRTSGLQNATLRGEEISFVVDRNGTRTLYRGRVDGDSIAAASGSAVDGLQPAQGWKASRAD